MLFFKYLRLLIEGHKIEKKFKLFTLLYVESALFAWINDLNLHYHIELQNTDRNKVPNLSSSHPIAGISLNQVLFTKFTLLCFEDF